MKIVNLTPHTINLPDREIAPSGQVAHVVEKIVSDYHNPDGVMIQLQELAEVTNLPPYDPNSDTIYIVSAMVLMAVRAMGNKRPDLFTPITRGEGVVKNEKGHITQVPGLRTF